ncbi:MAG: 5'-methylthioadenosine/S-adenosylhomocysteine nucleosidase [Bacteroidetes bacterium]|nr:5'-methylthioadenosine/S-adenosylhomocysteine nucleosidase [Bacteroidota bacterium]
MGIKDDCIPFDAIASIYDETRYFEPNKYIKTFEGAIKIIIEKFYDKENINIFDAGCGTGRIIMPFISHLVAFLTQKKLYDQDIELTQNYKDKIKNINDNCRRIEFNCLDISRPMLKVFQDKLLENDFLSLGNDKYEKRIGKIEFVVKLEEDDLRTYDAKLLKYDIVFAHWIFHTIRDWQLALFNIINISNNGSLLFTFKENSDLYSAIDNVYTESNKNLWESYFMLRNQIYSFYGQIPLSAKERIGSHVNDEKINDLISDLYHSKRTVIYSEDIDEWSKKYTYRYIINTIIKGQAFSNMRIERNNELLCKIYTNIADKVEEMLSIRGANTLDNNFNSTTKFSGYYYELHYQPSIALLIRLVYEVLDKKNPDDLFSIPYRAYSMFIEKLWEKLNDKDIADEIIIKEKNNVKGIIGIHFYDHRNNYRSVIKEYKCLSKTNGIEGSDVIKLWEHSNYSVDTDNCYVVMFDMVDPISDEGVTTFNIMDDHVAAIKKVLLSDSDITSLLTISNPITKLYRKAIKSRIIGVTDSDIINFFTGIMGFFELYSNNKEYNKVFYVFPNPVLSLSSERRVYGMILICRDLIKNEFFDFIDNFNKVIFGCLSSDIKIDLSVNFPVVVTRHQVREFKEKYVVDVTSPPDILLATCFAAEFEQAIKLAGIPKNKKEKRNIPFELETKIPHVYDITHENFKEKKVWLFQSFETGNNDYGIEATLNAVLEFINKKYNKLPDTVILGGVAAGMQENIQIRGQILFANSVVYFNNNDINNLNAIKINNQKIFSVKNDKLFISKAADYCKNIKDNFGYKTKYEQIIYEGRFVVVDEILNDYKKKEKILQICKEDKPVGLDMEGYGFVKCCNKHKINNIVICKGISDFAHHKDEVADFQKNIAKNTFDYIYYCIENMI